MSIDTKAIRNSPSVRYHTARYFILFICIFTFFNVIRLIGGSARYSLLSSFLAYLSMDFGLYYSGKYPGEYYKDVAIVPNETAYYVGIAVAVVVLLIYLATYIFSKKNGRFMKLALGVYVFDTLILVSMIIMSFNITFLINLIFSVYIIYHLYKGVKASKEALSPSPTAQDSYVSPEAMSYSMPEDDYDDSDEEYGDTNDTNDTNDTDDTDDTDDTSDDGEDNSSPDNNSNVETNF